MKHIINVYKNNREVVEHFLSTTINRLQIKELDEHSARRVFRVSRSTTLVYFVDKEYNLQSPYYFRNKIDSTKLGITKMHYFEKVIFSQNGVFISNPYISSSTGKAGVTFAYEVENGYIVIDFDLLNILEQLQLVQSNQFARIINKVVYGFMGFSLLFFALFLGVYAMYTFGVSVLAVEHFKLESTFKAIIALTLGLAIFDLAKTLLENELFFKNLSVDADDNEVLSKFLKSIIIALSIESLMVVFKIALEDYTNMIHALFLIIGVSLMVYVLGKFTTATKK